MFTLQQKAQAVIWITELKYPKLVQRKFQSVYGVEAPSINTIKSWKQKFLETGSVQVIKKKRRAHVVTEETLDEVSLTITENNQTSVRKIANSMSLTYSSALRCLKKLKLKPYKIQMLQHLNNNDYENRLIMCSTLLEMIKTMSSFCSLIIMSDEATFHLSGVVNKQNCRIWGEQNPHTFVEYQRDSPKVNVWCAVSQNKIYGPFFFAEKTITAGSYLDMLENFFYPQLESDGILSTCYFQQDGAPPHYATIVRDSLNAVFFNRWIGRKGPFNWAARSPDLTVLDFWLWGYVKSVVYTAPPRDIEDLKARISSAIVSIKKRTLKSVFQAWEERLQYCTDVDGKHFENM